MEKSHEFELYVDELVSKINQDLTYAEKRYKQEIKTNPEEAAYHSKSINVLNKIKEEIRSLQRLRDATLLVGTEPNMVCSDKYLCLSKIVADYADMQTDEEIKNKLENISNLIGKKESVKDLESLL